MFPHLSASRLLAIDLGASHVACAWFRPGAAGRAVACRDFVIERFNPDPGEGDQWLERTEGALRACLRGRRKPNDCVVALPAHLASTKVLRVPAVAGANRRKLIAFEAQQQLTYPLDDAIWEYTVIDDQGHELEVLLALARRHLLDAICGLLARHGLRPQRLLPGPLALVAGPGPAGGATVLRVDIGARSTQFAIRDDRHLTVRTGAVAGNTFTQAVAEDLGLSFGAAEAVKRRVFPADDLVPSEPAVRTAVERAMAAFVAQLQVEIVRARLDHRRHGGNDIDVVWLSGAGSRVHELDTRLARKTGLRVERNPLSTEGPSPPGRSDAPGGPIGDGLPTLMGLAAAGTGGDVFALNLLPTDVARQQAFHRRQPWLMIAAASMALGLLSPLFHYTRAAHVVSGQVERVEQEIQLRRAGRDRNAALRAELAELRHELSAMRELESERSYWIHVLGGLHELLTVDGAGWVDRLQVVSTPASRPPAGPAPQWFGTTLEPRSPAKTPMKIKVGGYLVDLVNVRPQSAPALRARVTVLLEQLGRAPFVAAIESERFDLTEPGLLRFEVVIALQLRRPTAEVALVSHE